MSQGTFDRRVALGLVVFALASFALGLWAAMTDRGSAEPAPDGQGRSAVGHAGLLAVLDELGVPVERRRTAPTAAPGAVSLVLAPAWRDLDAPERRAQAARIQGLLAAGPVLVSLPRFRAVSGALPDEVERLYADERAPAHTLEVLGVTGTAEVTGEPAAGPGPLPVPVHRGWQVLTGTDLTPVLTAGDGVLLGRKGDLWVLADPTPLTNLGLGQASNGAFAAGLLARVGHGVEARVVFDDSVHGLGKAADVWRRVFEFPLVLGVWQALGVLLLLAWAGASRFGAPVPPAPALGRGRAVLLENMARLGWYGGHTAEALGRYWHDALQAVADATHAPRGLLGDPAGLCAWLDALAVAHDRPADAQALAAELSEPRTPAAQVRLARRIHGWRAGWTKGTT